MRAVTGVPISEKAIEDCSTDFELGNPTIEGAGDNALTKEFANLGLRGNFFSRVR